MSKLTGSFCTTASGSLSYDIAEADSAVLPKIALLVQEKFGFVPDRFLDGFDVLWIDCCRDNLTLTFGWDIWSGCFVMAAPGTDSAIADPLIREIGTFLETQLGRL